MQNLLNIFYILIKIKVNFNDNKRDMITFFKKKN